MFSSYRAELKHFWKIISWNQQFCYYGRMTITNEKSTLERSVCDGPEWEADMHMYAFVLTEIDYFNFWVFTFISFVQASLVNHPSSEAFCVHLFRFYYHCKYWLGKYLTSVRPESQRNFYISLRTLSVCWIFFTLFLLMNNFSKETYF